MHENGKIKMINTVAINSLEDLRKVYTLGVAEVFKLIMSEAICKDTYTSIPYSVAIVTDGTSVNNLVGYPGIWRGTLDAKATRINYEMYLAASSAIVGCYSRRRSCP